MKQLFTYHPVSLYRLNHRLKFNNLISLYLAKPAQTQQTAEGHESSGRSPSKAQ